MKKQNLALAALMLGAVALSAQTQPAASDAKQAPAAKTTSMDLDAPKPAAEPVGGTKINPKAKTAQEGKDFSALLKIEDGAAALTAADAFAAKYADSALLASAYSLAADRLRHGGAIDQAITVYRKSLTLDDSNPFVLSTVADLIAQSTHSSDLDLKDRATEINKLAQQAIDGADQIRNTAGRTPEEIATARDFMLSQAYDALGRAAFYTKHYAVAETNFQKYIDVTVKSPDAVSYLLLGLSQQSESKFELSIATFDKGIEIAKKTQSENLVPTFEGQKILSQKKWDAAKKLAAARAAQQSATPAATTTTGK